MRSRLNTLADRLVTRLVPKITAGACACNGYEYECSSWCTITRCARVGRNCDCSKIISRSCVSLANCNWAC